MDDLEDKDNFLSKYEPDMFLHVKQEDWECVPDVPMNLNPDFYGPNDKHMEEDADHCFGNKLNFGIEPKGYVYPSLRKDSDVKPLKSPDAKTFQKWKEDSHDTVLIKNT